MPPHDPSFDRKLAAIFEAEATEHVQRMETCLAEIAGGVDGPGAKQPLELLFRAAHSLKGAARAVGEDEVETVCHATESLLAALQHGRADWSSAILDALHDVVAALRPWLAGRDATPGSLSALVPRLQRLARDSSAPAAIASPDAAPQRPAATAAPVAPADGAPTLRIPVARLGNLLYQVEELLAIKLQARQRVAQVDEVLASFSGLRAAAGDAPQAHRAWRRHEAHLQALRTSTVREQRLLSGAIDALLADVKKTLLLPVASMRPFLVATVRELARSQGKEVELRMLGDDVEMDRRLLQELREPLVHLLRNAIDHGVEMPRERSAARKPACGVLEVAIAARSTGAVEIRVSDDGAGVDTERLAQVARELRSDVPEDADPDALLPLVFGHGVSTAARLTEVSGRGVGLAIVREIVERMGGSIAVASTRGQGTTFTISLATSLATYRALEVRAGGRTFLLPTARLERALRVAPAGVRKVGGRATVAVGDQDLPLLPLAGVLRLPPQASPGPHLHGVVIGTGDRRLVLVVDEIGAEQEVLAKPLGTAPAQASLVAGAAALQTGRMAPILNVPELARLALREGARTAAAEVAAPARPRGRSVLLAEDSITSRTLLKNVLELAGHRVEVAVDGAEALQRLRQGSFDVVVSDIEMPRLDGIALTQAIRSDPALAHLPVVLVTSLASPADRARGAEAGANAYIVKSGFDQGSLLDAVAELVP